MLTALQSRKSFNQENQGSDERDCRVLPVYPPSPELRRTGSPFFCSAFALRASADFATRCRLAISTCLLGVPFLPRLRRTLLLSVVGKSGCTFASSSYLLGVDSPNFLSTACLLMSTACLLAISICLLGVYCLSTRHFNLSTACRRMATRQTFCLLGRKFKNFLNSDSRD